MRPAAHLWHQGCYRRQADRATAVTLQHSRGQWRQAAVRAQRPQRRDETAALRRRGAENAAAAAKAAAENRGGARPQTTDAVRGRGVCEQRRLRQHPPPRLDRDAVQQAFRGKSGNARRS